MAIVLIQGVVSVLLGLVSGFGLGMLTFEEMEVFRKFHRAVLLVVLFVFSLSLLQNLSDNFASVLVLFLSMFLVFVYLGLLLHMKFISH